MAALLLLGAVGACKGKAGGESASDDAAAGSYDAGPPDAAVRDAGAIVETGQLPGTGRVAGGTVTMDVEIGNSIEPAVLKGGTYTLEISGDVAPQP